MKNTTLPTNKTKEYLTTQEIWLLHELQLENIPISLVTSIPSVETYNNIINKKYHITRLTKRYKEALYQKLKL